MWALRTALLSLVALCLMAAPLSARPVDLALVLAVDVSGSISDERFNLQRNGYAAAFTNPLIVDAIASGRNKAIAVTMVQWSGLGHQAQVVDWTVIDGPFAARTFGSAIAEMPRLYSDFTAVGEAIAYCTQLLRTGDFEAERRAIDVSGDGANNGGRPVEAARDEAVAAGIVINGLPMLATEPMLDTYYRNSVIGGPGAFVIVVADDASFQRALLDKLMKEIVEAPAAESERADASP
jgi:Protein of unknown function (DUF1194)